MLLRNLDDEDWSGVAEYDYTGSSVKPYGKIGSLVVGKDYTATYSSNVEPGTAKCKLTGIGNYTGTKTIKFTIVKDYEDE